MRVFVFWWLSIAKILTIFRKILSGSVIPKKAQNLPTYILLEMPSKRESYLSVNPNNQNPSKIP
jgi:hypothetical protein